MKLIDDYNTALTAIHNHLGFPHGHEFLVIDMTDMYWHLVKEGVICNETKDVDEDHYIYRLCDKYDKRVFGGIALTGILTGRIPNEVLRVFDNSKYVGNLKLEKKFI